MEIYVWKMNKKSFLVLLILLLGSCKIAYSTYGGVTLSAWTNNPPTIDGEPQPLEWDNADKVDFSTDNPVPHNGTLFVMNDRENLYILIEFEHTGNMGSIKIFFDNDNDEDEWDPDDDGLCYEWGPPPAGFTDIHFSAWNPDTTQNGEGAHSTLGDWKYVEFSHPLDSGDPEDFSLTIGDTVGFQIMSQFDNTGYWPPQAQTTNDIIIAGPVEEPVGGLLLPNIPLRNISIILMFSLFVIFTVYNKNKIVYQQF